MKDLEKLKQAVVRVGGARGFVTEDCQGDRLIITAAHCLQMPGRFACIHDEQRVYANVIGKLGEPKTIWAECAFVDSVNDIAVLTEPEVSSVPGEWESYMAFVGAIEPLSLADVPADERPVGMLSLKGNLIRTTGQHINDGPMWLTNAAEIIGGMSGSPVVTEAGAAIGVVSLSSNDFGIAPRFGRSLPGWLLRKFGLLQNGAVLS